MGSRFRKIKLECFNREICLEYQRCKSRSQNAYQTLVLTSNVNLSTIASLTSRSLKQIQLPYISGKLKEFNRLFIAEST